MEDEKVEREVRLLGVGVVAADDEGEEFDDWCRMCWVMEGRRQVCLECRRRLRVSILIFHQALTITTHINNEEQICRHILEAMDLFLPLAPLTANIDHESLM